MIGAQTCLLLILDEGKADHPTIRYSAWSALDC